ncbi:unnamed protein product [Lathyrus oleraceus]
MKNQAQFSCSYAQKLASIFASILLLFHQKSLAKHHQPCPTSSCGKIKNITYPFRLKTDPNHCGDTRYELDCDENGASLTMFSGKYYVQHIDYKRFKISLSDAGAVEDTNCSFIPRYFLYDRSFNNVLFGEEDFGSEPFVLDPINPTRIAYFSCSNPINDPRYVNVDTSHCRIQWNSHVYAVLEPSLFEYSVEDIKVGCDFMVATLGKERSENMKEKVSYDEIRGMIIDGVEVSWLPVICESRCGKGTSCKVVDEKSGEVQCDKRICHYAYQTTDKCELQHQIFGYTRAYLRGIFIGLGSRITFSTRQLDNPVGLEYFDGGIFIGRNVIPLFIAARIVFGVILLLVLFIYKWRRRHVSMYDNIENFLLESNLNPIRYEYKEIKKMTGGLRLKLGQGGFGAVYKGKLRSGPDVAIKMLTKFSVNNGQDFINEVATIGRIHHVNVVRLVGYCVEGKKSALIYEFMPNGSLDKYIFPKEGIVPLSYEKIYEISLGIARGIAYLHQGCDMQILHFDIKPHNILLDEDFVPKVSDFGLAKLYPVNDSIVPLTAARGTLGYMAPELFYKNIGGVSYKADVYSFGMLLMEMAGKRKNSNPNAERSSQHYFPFWIYDQFKQEKDIDIMENVSEEGVTVAKKMFMVALWCIQLKPSERPSMNKVVEMLEGKTESLELPPRPSFYPNESYKHHDEMNSDQTSWSDSSSIGQTSNNYSLDNDS